MDAATNIECGKGETLSVNIEILNPDDSPVDLTSHTANLVILRKGNGALVATYAATVDALGNVSAKAPDEDTATWSAGIYAYRVILEDLAGDKTWPIWGRLTIKDGL